MNADTRHDDGRTVEMTADGSATLYVPSLDEHYHSVKGALTEARWIYLLRGLIDYAKPSARILEIGLGTGLNAAVSVCGCGDISVTYYGLERYPLPPSFLDTTGYADTLPVAEARMLRLINNAPWGTPITLTPAFSLYKIEGSLTDATQPLPGDIDIVYFDAFAPDKQPEMWTAAVFSRIFSLMRPGAVLVTYCAKGDIRRRLQATGFTTERLPGPPQGKREILRARKPL